MGVPAMSLSSWERQALDSIKDGLARSDPRLAALLGTFTRLASSEDMPAQEKIAARARRTVPCSQRKPRQRGQAGACACSRSSLGLIDSQWAVMLLWLVITVAMITVAVLSNRGASGGTCTGSWPPICRLGR
jgi:hypothetical protein